MVLVGVNGKAKGPFAQLPTRSLCDIHARLARADVNNMADVVTRICNILPTFFLDFLSSEEEDTLFMNDAEDEFVLFYDNDI